MPMAMHLRTDISLLLVVCLDSCLGYSGVWGLGGGIWCLGVGLLVLGLDCLCLLGDEGREVGEEDIEKEG